MRDKILAGCVPRSLKRGI